MRIKNIRSPGAELNLILPPPLLSLPSSFLSKQHYSVTVQHPVLSAFLLWLEQLLKPKRKQAIHFLFYKNKFYKNAKPQNW